MPLTAERLRSLLDYDEATGEVAGQSLRVEQAHHDRADNRFANLRPATASQSGANSLPQSADRVQGCVSAQIRV